MLKNFCALIFVLSLSSQSLALELNEEALFTQSGLRFIQKRRRYFPKNFLYTPLARVVKENLSSTPEAKRAALESLKERHPRLYDAFWYKWSHNFSIRSQAIKEILPKKRKVPREVPSTDTTAQAQLEKLCLKPKTPAFVDKKMRNGGRPTRAEIKRNMKAARKKAEKSKAAEAE